MSTPPPRPALAFALVTFLTFLLSFTLTGCESGADLEAESGRHATTAAPAVAITDAPRPPNCLDACVDRLLACKAKRPEPLTPIADPAPIEDVCGDASTECLARCLESAP